MCIILCFNIIRRETSMTRHYRCRGLLGTPTINEHERWPPIKRRLVGFLQVFPTPSQLTSCKKASKNRTGVPADAYCNLLYTRPPIKRLIRFLPGFPDSVPIDELQDSVQEGGVEVSLQIHAATMFWLEVAVNINSTLLWLQMCRRPVL